jgi:hypothetical protein
MLNTGVSASRADLARQLGVSRSRVTQVLAVLALTPGVVQTLAALGDPLPEPIVTERGLRSLLKLSAEGQEDVLLEIVYELEGSSRDVHPGGG